MSDKSCICCLIFDEAMSDVLYQDDRIIPPIARSERVCLFIKLNFAPDNDNRFSSSFYLESYE